MIYQMFTISLFHSTPDVSSLGSSVPLQLGLPVAVPPQYSGLKEVSIEAVRARLRLLYHFSDLMYSSWRLLNLSPNNQVGNEPQLNLNLLIVPIESSLLELQMKTCSGESFLM